MSERGSFSVIQFFFLLILLAAVAVCYFYRDNFTQTERQHGPKQEYQALLASHGHIGFDYRLNEFPILNVGDPTTPEKILEPHLEIVLSIMPTDHRSALGEVYAGIFPYKTPNARVVRCPNGGVLILVNQGLVTTLYSWAQALVDVTLLVGSGQPDIANRLDQIYSAFQDSKERYHETQFVSSLEYIASLETRTVSSLITWSAVWFVLAHECAHAIRGEYDTALTGDCSNHGWGHEIPVDRLAMELFQLRPTDPKYKEYMDVRLVGATYALGILRILEEGVTDEAMDATFRNMDLAMQWVEQNVRKAEDNQEFTRVIRVGRTRLRQVVNSGYVRSSQLHPVERAKRAFWVAYAGRNMNAQQHLVLDDPLGHRSWAVGLHRKATALEESKSRLNEKLGDNMFGFAKFVTYPRWSYTEKFDSTRLRSLANAVEKALASVPSERFLRTAKSKLSNKWESEDSQEIGETVPISSGLLAEEYAQKAVHFLKAGELQKALEQQNAAIRLNPERASLYHYRGAILAMWNKCEEAIPDFEKAISMNKNYIEPYAGLADCFFEIGQFSRGITMLDRAIELTKLANPEDLAPELVAALYLYRFDAMYAQNNKDEAMKDFKRVVQIISDPQVAKAFVNAEQAGEIQVLPANYLLLSKLLWAEKQHESFIIISEHLLSLTDEKGFSNTEIKELAQTVQHIKRLQLKKKRLEELQRQKEEDERKRLEKIAILKKEREEKIISALRPEVEKYKKIVLSEFGQSMKTAAWQSLLAKCPPGWVDGVKEGDVDKILLRPTTRAILAEQNRSKILFKDNFQDNRNAWGEMNSASADLIVRNGGYNFSHKRKKDSWITYKDIGLSQYDDFIIDCKIEKI